MRKIALVFVTAVFVPSLVLAWLALCSLRDQQFLVEREQAASWQGLAGALARQVNGTLTEQRREFSRRVDELIGDKNIYDVFFFQAEDGIRDYKVTGVQTCALPI